MPVELVGLMAAGGETGVRCAAPLLELAEAGIGRDAARIGAAQSAVRQALSEAALIDAAAVIGGFDAITRVADATGTPLEPEKAARSVDMRATLGIDAFDAERARLG